MRWRLLLACSWAGALSAACLDISPAQEPAADSGVGATGGAGGWPSAGAGGTSSGGSAGASSGGSAGASSGGSAGVSSGGSAATGNGGSDAGGGVGFYARGVGFDGTYDWLDLATGFLGAGDTTTASGSIWFKRIGLGSTYCIGPEAAGSGSPNQLEWTDTNRFRVVWRQAGGGVACDFASSPITDTASWHHVLFSVDTTGSKAQLWVDGVSDISVSKLSPVMLDNTGSQWGLFADNGGNAKYNGEVAELWIAMGQLIDFSVAANREKFRSAGGKPVDLGSDGSLPTGSAPTIYLSLRESQPLSAFAVNRGTGGGFVVHGGLEVALTSPSD